MSILEYFLKYKYPFVFMVLFSSFFFILIRYYISHKKNRFVNRDDCPIEEIYEDYFKSIIPKDFFIELWLEVAQTLHLPPGKLRPEDRFNKELMPSNICDYGNEDLAILMSERIKKINIHKVDLENVKTLRDYILIFSDNNRTKNK